ncbi:MAG: 3-hydroxyacyl-ACP dehydratase [Bacteroidota bacterium]
MTPVTDILNFIPQRDPFVMIDQLIACDETSAVTLLTVRPDNFFANSGVLMEPALVENIAQTAAVRIGYICKQENKPVPIGYIAAIQHLVVKKLPRTGDSLQTEIVVKNKVLNVTIVTGNVKVNDEIVASCEMKIFISQ